MNIWAASAVHPIHLLVNVCHCTTVADSGKNLIFVPLYYEKAFLTEGNICI